MKVVVLKAVFYLQTSVLLVFIVRFWMKFGIQNVHKTVLSASEFLKKKKGGKNDTSLMGANELHFLISTLIVRF